MHVRIGEGFQLAAVKANGEHRREYGSHFAVAQCAFASAAIYLYQNGNIEQFLYSFLGIVKVLTDFSHSLIIANERNVYTSTSDCIYSATLICLIKYF